jgi:hypothetical protein
VSGPFDQLKSGIFPLPDDTSLGEACRFLHNASWFKEVFVDIRLRCVDLDGVEYPDTVTVGQFRELSERGLALVQIDDRNGGGGMPVKTPENV